MGCCSNSESSKQLQFNGLDLYDSQIFNSNLQNKAVRSTAPSENTNTEHVNSEISSENSIRLADPHTMQAEEQEEQEEEVILAHTWPGVQSPAKEKQAETCKTEDLSTRGQPKCVRFSDPPLPQKVQKAIDFKQNAYLRYRFGPLTTINEEESQQADTLKLSEFGSRPQLNNPPKPLFQE